MVKNGLTCAAILLLQATSAAEPIRLDIDPRYDYRPDGTIHVVVKEVIEGGIAHREGIKSNERIVLIDGQPIQSVEQLHSRLAAGPPIDLYIRNVANTTTRVARIAAQGAAAPTLPPPGNNPLSNNPPGNAGKGAGFIRLTNELLGSSRSLTSDSQGRLRMRPSSQSAGQRWRIVSAGAGKRRLINDRLGPDWSLTATPGSSLPTLEPIEPGSSKQHWRIIPLGNDSFQIVHVRAGIHRALDIADQPDHAPGIAARADVAAQRWRITDLAPAGDSLVGTWAVFRTASDRPTGVEITIAPDLTFVQFDNGAEVNRGTANISNGRLVLLHANGEPEMLRYLIAGDRVVFLRSNDRPEVFYWRALKAPPPIVLDLEPRLISRKTLPNPPLESVTLDFDNLHEDELLVVIRDLRNKAGSVELKIPSGRSKALQLERDSGGRVVETWEIPLRNGDVVLDERETVLPPRPLYTVSVYEMFVQSIAIDSTKKGRGRIEDISRAPKSVGAFTLPPGAELQDGSIDVYNTARRQRNPGAVDRIDPAELQSEDRRRDDPIQRILRGRR
jgi:PDZ domain